MQLSMIGTVAETAQPTERANPATTGRLGDWRFATALTIVALLLTSAPFVYGFASAPPDRQFMGMMLDVPDHVQYFAWMRDLAHQSLAANRLTPEPNAPALFNLLWWGVGRAGVYTGLDYAQLFGILRVVAILFLMATLHTFLTLTVPAAGTRRIAFAIATFGGGLGIIWVIVKYAMRLPDAPFPFDLYTAEQNTFTLMLGFPHFTIALGLILTIFCCVLLGLRSRHVGYAIGAGLTGFVLGLQHAYDLLTVFAVLGLFGLFIWRRDRRFPRQLFVSGGIIGLLSAPPAAYCFWLVQTDPTWKAVLAQFDVAAVFTPKPQHLPILLGVPFLCALATLRPRFFRTADTATLFILAWFLAHFPLAYLPVDFQIHLLLGWQVPIAILAARVLVEQIGPKLASLGNYRAALGICCIAASIAVTNLYTVTWRFVELRRHETPFYLSLDEIAALDWLAANTTRHDVVLGDEALGQFVPMWSDARAFIAHWANTLDFHTKRRLVNAVLDPATPSPDRRAILARYDVDYLIIRPTGGSRDAWLDGFDLAYERGNVAIYRVR